MFSTPFSLGNLRMRMEGERRRSASAYRDRCRASRIGDGCGESRHATLNIGGSCSNLCDGAGIRSAARNQADIAWMRETFERAKETHAVAVMLIAQADPGWDQSDVTRGPLRDPKTLVQTDGQPDGYVDFLTELRDAVIDFAKPVAYVHGDSHYFRVDKPFLDASGRRLENFTRVETFGDNQGNGNNDVHWLKVLVDSHSREVLAHRRRSFRRTARPRRRRRRANLNRRPASCRQECRSCRSDRPRASRSPGSPVVASKAVPSALNAAARSPGDAVALRARDADTSPPVPARRRHRA